MHGVDCPPEAVITESMWHAYVHYKYKVGRAEVQLALVETQCPYEAADDCQQTRGELVLEKLN